MKTKTGGLFLFLILLSCLPLCSFAHIDSKKTNFDLYAPQPTLIEILEDGESYSIEILSIGCFNGSRQTVIISRKDDILIASLQDSSKVLSDSDIELFKTFELQLRALKTGGCTTVDTYLLRFKNETFRTSDGTCSWHGYRKLLAMFN